VTTGMRCFVGSGGRGCRRVCFRRVPSIIVETVTVAMSGAGVGGGSERPSRRDCVARVDGAGYSGGRGATGSGRVRPHMGV